MSEQHAMMPVLEWPTYGSNQFDKTSYLLNELTKLTHFHDGACLSYHHVLQKFIHPQRINNLADLPFLPVRLFKHEKLLSVRPEEVVKTMTSSGTSGQSVSQIFLDKETSAMQVKVLSRIMSEFIGPKRLPMLVIDCRATIANRYNFSARAAGILGFSIFGRDTEFALNDDMTLDINRVRDFAKKHQGQKILLFGFTFIVWKHLVKILEDNPDLSRWKLATGNLEFSWLSRILKQIPNQIIQWESVDGLPNRGAIRFYDRHGSSIVKLTISYAIPGILGQLMDNLFLGGVVESTLQKDLERFKDYAIEYYGNSLN